MHSTGYFEEIQKYQKVCEMQVKCPPFSLHTNVAKQFSYSQFRVKHIKDDQAASLICMSFIITIQQESE